MKIWAELTNRPIRLHRCFSFMTPFDKQNHSKHFMICNDSWVIHNFKRLDETKITVRLSNLNVNPGRSYALPKLEVWLSSTSRHFVPGWDRDVWVSMLKPPSPQLRCVITVILVCRMVDTKQQTTGEGSKRVSIESSAQRSARASCHPLSRPCLRRTSPSHPVTCLASSQQ